MEKKACENCLKQPPIIHIVDDDEDFQISLRRLLRAAGYEVSLYLNAGDFLLSGATQHPGCILLDIQMPGPSGVDLQAALARQPGALPVIFISGHADIANTVLAMKQGAVDFLVKPVTREILFKTVEKALALDLENRAVREHNRKWQDLYLTLSSREREVFDRVVAGAMNKVIAVELGVAIRTVKAYRAALMEKMKVSSLAELVHIADQLRPGQYVPMNPRLMGHSHGLPLTTPAWA